MTEKRFLAASLHGPGAKYRELLPSMIEQSPEFSSSTKAAMMDRVYTTPVFYTRDNLDSWIKEDDRPAMEVCNSVMGT